MFLNANIFLHNLITKKINKKKNLITQVVLDPVVVVKEDKE